jgi:hypothetical protein
MLVGEDTTPPQPPPVPALYAPIQIDPALIRNLLHSWIKSLWFAPSDIMSKVTIGQIHGTT